MVDVLGRSDSCLFYQKPPRLLAERRANPMGKFILKTVASGYKFDLKATNGQTILTYVLY